MDHKNLIVVKEANKDIETKVLEQILLLHGGSFSAAVAEMPEGRPLISYNSVSLKDTDHPKGALGEVMDILEQGKEFKMVLCFSSDDIDPQPFTLVVNEQDEPQMVVFLDGDFAEKGRENDGHTHEYMEADESITPTVLELFEKVSGDVPELVKLIREPRWAKQFSRMGNGDEMAVFFFASNGIVTVFNREGHALIKYDFGVMSYEIDKKPEMLPAKPADKPVEPEPAAKKGGFFSKLKEQAKEGGVHTTDAKPTKLNDQSETAIAARMAKAQELRETKGDKKPEGKVEDTMHDMQTLCLVRIPKDISTVNLNGFLTKRMPGGDKPDNWESWKNRDIVVPLGQLLAISSTKRVSDVLAKHPPATREQIKAISNYMTIPSQEEAKPSVPTVPDKKVDATPAADQPLVIPPKHIVALENHFFKHKHVVACLDKHFESIQDPRYNKFLENKVPEAWTFFKQFKCIEDTFSLDEQSFNEMGNGSLTTLAKFTTDYKNLCIRQAQRLEELEAKTAQYENKTVTPVKGEKEQPKKGGFFAQRKAA